MKSYVAGFMFNPEYTMVALIRKNKPDWQRGYLNGIGGKIEEGESANDAMRREFIEEAGYETKEWRQFCTLSGGATGGGFDVHFFKAVGPITTGLMDMTDEKIEIHSVEAITPYRRDIIPNLAWLIPMALNRNLNSGIGSLMAQVREL